MNQYLKATVWASVIYLVVPIVFLYMIFVEMQSPEWDTNDSGAAQGLVYMIVAMLSALACVAVAFPLIAKKLQPNFTTRKWFYLNVVTVWLTSLIASFVFWYSGGGANAGAAISAALHLSLLLTPIGMVLMLPAMFIWLRVAKMNHKKSSQQDTESDASA